MANSDRLRGSLASPATGTPRMQAQVSLWQDEPVENESVGSWVSSLRQTGPGVGGECGTSLLEWMP